MKMMTISVVLVGAFVISGPLAAATVNIGEVSVERTLIIQDRAFGGCMFQVDVTLSAQGADCPSNWVSLSCTGDFMESERAWRMMDSAQMAMALGLKLRVWVNDHQKHNNYCVADRIDVVR